MLMKTHLNTKDTEFEQLCSEVQACVNCPRMNNSARILSGSVGSLDAKIMFIGEAPGRRGADSSGIPFHGDRAGNNFEALLEFSGLNRSDIFVTNAVLCNPKDSKGNNAPPNKTEVKNCSAFLRRQIELVNPKIVTTLGGTALNAVNLLENHTLNLKSHVRTSINWFNRILTPLYHHGQRAMIHRSFANQRSDYQFVSEIFRRLDGYKRKSYGKTSADIANILNIMLTARPSISYFALHKLFYLVEYSYVKEFGHRLTGAYFIRQKDGPYCTDLHISKIKKALPKIRIETTKQKLFLFKNSPTLFSGRDFLDEDPNLTTIKDFIYKIFEKYGGLTDGKLKNAVYMTQPMRKILRLEKNKKNLFNSPIEFNDQN
jgi:uracil-DNA glycosylase family 4